MKKKLFRMQMTWLLNEQMGERIERGFVFPERDRVAENSQISANCFDGCNLNLGEIYRLLLVFVYFKQFEIYSPSLLMYLNSCKTMSMFCCSSLDAHDSFSWENESAIFVAFR